MISVVILTFIIYSLNVSLTDAYYYPIYIHSNGSYECGKTCIIFWSTFLGVIVLLIIGMCIYKCVKRRKARSNHMDNIYISAV